DGSDFYLAVFSKNLDELAYATFLGGFGADEHVDGGTSRFDRKGIVYQSVCAGCGGNSLLKTTDNAYSRTNNSANCNNAILKLDFENLNRAPVVNDAVYTVVAGNTLTFNIDATDADRYDSLTMHVDESFFTHTFPNPRPTITKPSGKGTRQLQATFSWDTKCLHLTGDTIYIPVVITDEGCPDFKNDSALIKVLVLPPPVIPPPGVLCVVPETPTSIKLRWDNADTANPYFSHFIIVKTDPAGNVSNLGPFTKADKFEYIDKAVNDYRNQNYCYYIYSVNICEVKGANSYTICTKDQFNAPIKSTDVVTATVVDNKDVKLVWKDTKEDDFESYLVYRARKSSHGVENYQFYASTNKTDDTAFVDTKVDVSKDAYCYKLQVIDQCGHISQFSNKGCNIVLTGVSRPYEHHLNWDTYNDWSVGVDNYELIRWDSRQNPATNYQGPPVTLNHMDNNFDYDYGIYWYKIVATESGGNEAISESNTVKLVQRPLLHVPTGFTPNGDKLNDGWGQVDVFVKDYHLQVFNRWGEKVFESFDKNAQWTGDFKGTGPADNVFIWIVRYTGWDNSIHTQKGTVTILN
ncbi:MAG TPA: gliding motility-associated C-terminal domain-containing protein, partial [Bacteroidia bacterium]|nr:gliding motility-associated C-terminal domain-containing protein [Bacteroidia bacterium]